MSTLGARVGYIEKAVLILNLLHNRRCVTLKTIQKVCGLSERSAYRQIAALSQAHIPVRYDQALRGYCIDRRDCQAICDLAPNDIVMLLLSLEILEKNLNHPYLDDVKRLKSRILSKLSYSLEDSWGLVETDLNKSIRSERVSELLTGLILQTSVQRNRQLRLHVSDGGIPRIVVLRAPVLRFEDQWYVEDSGTRLEAPVPVSKIRRAAIV